MPSKVPEEDGLRQQMNSLNLNCNNVGHGSPEKTSSSPSRCMGRCDIELGDVNKHNVMVCRGC